MTGIRNTRNKSSWGMEPGKDTEGAHLHAGFIRLMAAVLRQCYFDLAYGDLGTAISAHEWLLEDGPIYTEVLEIDGHPCDPITSGKAKLARRKLRK